MVLSDDKDAAAASPAADGCPVDHHARAAWLEKAAQAGDARQTPHPMPHSAPAVSSATGTTRASPAQAAPSSSSSSSWTSWLWSSSPKPAANPSSSSSSSTPSRLGNDRETSTIPRAPSSPESANQPSVAPQSPPSSQLPQQRQAASHGSPSNSEVESGASSSGHWVYPSERMFFDAMRRKQFSPEARDMASVVPIHNAVNERAWAEIKAWEARFAGAREKNARCGGPRLASFSGDSRKKTPKARWNGLLGYQEPFDRHDWVVERCDPSDTVEYVIDFYQGRDTAGRGGLNFYLDVRPKLNTLEGCRMRALSWLGW